MLIKDIITSDFPTLDFSTTKKEGKLIAKEFNTSHLPITHDNMWVGNIRLECLKNLKDDEPIQNISKHLERFSIMESQTIIETFVLFSNFNANIIPVTDNLEKNRRNCYSGAGC